jgi:hypothetical protein
MNAEGLALWGLFFAVWAHQLQHVYERTRSRATLGFWLGISFTSLFFLLWALVKAFGWVS